ncbi:MAG: hypothetical protein V2B14_00200 [bacterium]
MKLVISIPVHEQPKVVIDQIKNIRYFAPNAVIVLHISKNFNWTEEDEDKTVFSKLDGVLVNPEQLPTQWGNITQAHHSNFKYALKNYDFDYFAIHASNDLFVAKGVEEYLKGYDAGVQQFSTARDMGWIQREGADKDNNLSEMMKFVGTDKILGSQPEGTFYKTEIFNEMLNIIDKFQVYTNVNYCKEEIYYPTLASKIAGNITIPYLYSSVCRKEITEKIIDNIRQKSLDEPEYEERYGITYRFYDMKNLYAVKRINRKINDPMRCYIRDLV